MFRIGEGIPMSIPTFEMLMNRNVESITEIAKAEGLPRTYAVLDGTRPIDLSLDRLINAKLPLDWAEQRSVLGFK
jgi:hypothetical protein